jgi:hypothetical protein
MLCIVSRSFYSSVTSLLAVLIKYLALILYAFRLSPRQEANASKFTVEFPILNTVQYPQKWQSFLSATLP